MKKVAIHYVNGTLSLSRAIGDPDYKLPQINKPSCPWEFPNGAARTFTDSVVSATPEIMTVQLSPGDDFMILACDGLWDVLFPEKAIEMVKHMLKDLTRTLDSIAKELCHYALKLGSSDNISCIIVDLNFTN